MPADLRAYLEARAAVPAGFSPDGSKIGVLSNLTGTMQLYVASVDGGDLTAITAEAEPVSGGYLPDRDAFLVLMDRGGDEQHGIYEVSANGGPLTPLSADPSVKHMVTAVSRDGKHVAFAANARNQGDFDVHVLDLATAERRIVVDDGGYWYPFSFSPDGRWLVVSVGRELAMDNDMYLVDLAGGGRIHVTPHDGAATFERPAWLPDSSAFFFPTDHGRDVTSIARYDIAARSWEYVIDTDWDASCTVDWAGRSLLVHLNEDGYSRIQRYDPQTLAFLGDLPLPGRGVVSTISLSHDGALVAIDFMSPSESSDAWIIDLDAGTGPRRVTSMPNELDRAAMVEPSLHRYPSFDGEQIPVFLYTPSGDAPEGGHPVVVVIHGGPEGQSRPIWNGLLQYLVAHSYAVAVPNVRGSVGYGKRYHHLDDIEKRLDSVADLAGLHDWLAARGDVDASRAALFGGSYGGYMVLAGLTFQPERWAAAVDIVGISSLVTFLENTSDYRRKMREREYGSLAEHRQLLHEVSPLTHIDNLRAPLFIIHGANRLDAYPRAVAFLDDVLGVR